MEGTLARKLERAVEALYAEIKKLPRQPRAAILGRLEAVRAELRAVFAGVIKPGPAALYWPDWGGAPTPRRRGKK
jgi:hypothetical protein